MYGPRITTGTTSRTAHQKVSVRRLFTGCCDRRLEEKSLFLQNKVFTGFWTSSCFPHPRRTCLLPVQCSAVQCSGCDSYTGNCADAFFVFEMFCKLKNSPQPERACIWSRWYALQVCYNKKCFFSLCAHFRCWDVERCLWNFLSSSVRPHVFSFLWKQNRFVVDAGFFQKGSPVSLGSWKKNLWCFPNKIYLLF